MQRFSAALTRASAIVPRRPPGLPGLGDRQVWPFVSLYPITISISARKALSNLPGVHDG